jgi:hypothetical protein
VLKLKKMIYFPLYIDRWLGSRTVNRLDLAAQGLFIRCLVLQWDSGPLPIDPADIASDIGNPRGFGETWPKIERLFPVVGDGRLNHRGAVIKEEWDDMRRIRTEAGRNGNTARWSTSTPSQNYRKNIAKLNESGTDASPPTPTPTPTPDQDKRGEREARGRAPQTHLETALKPPGGAEGGWPVDNLVLEPEEPLRGSKAQPGTELAVAPRHIRRRPVNDPNAAGSMAHGPPDLIVVMEWGESQQPPIESQRCERFYDHFTSNGWLVSGKTPMKNWQAALRNWRMNDLKFAAERAARMAK